MIKINLLPKESRKRVGLGQQIFLLVMLLILNFAGIGFYWSYLNNLIEEKQRERPRSNSDWMNFNALLPKLKSLKDAERL
jgi:hypothetical protein